MLRYRVRVMTAEDQVPDGVPGVRSHRVGWLPLQTPPTWWIGIAPPVTKQGEPMADRYQIHLTTPLVTVWRRR